MTINYCRTGGMPVRQDLRYLCRSCGISGLNLLHWQGNRTAVQGRVRYSIKGAGRPGKKGNYRKSISLICRSEPARSLMMIFVSDIVYRVFSI